MLHSLLADTVQFTINEQVLFLNSAADPFVPLAAQQLSAGELLLAEDSVAALKTAQAAVTRAQSTTRLRSRSVVFHEYTLHKPTATIDAVVMNMLYQPNNAWLAYALQLARYALKPGGHFYVEGAKDRGVLSMAKRMQSAFGNVETLAISKGQRVLCSVQRQDPINAVEVPLLTPFAEGKLDEGTRMLLDALEVRATDIALDIGCGSGYIGLHIARLATKGHVTMVDASLASVAAAQRLVEVSGLTNIQALPSDGIEAVATQRFDLVATNPPFHLGRLQTTEVAERFIREAAQVLRPRGRFYLVANRFLKYEPVLRTHFKSVEEVTGDARFKVLRSANHIFAD